MFWILRKQTFLTLLQKLEEETLNLLSDRRVLGGDL